MMRQEVVRAETTSRFYFNKKKVAQSRHLYLPGGRICIYYSRNYCKIKQNKSIKQITTMIIGKDTEYQTLEESIDYDIANALDYYNNDIDCLKAELYDEVLDDDCFIPMEYIPAELIGIDTDNMTEDQAKLWSEAKWSYVVDYRFWWRNKVTELKRAQREEEESRWHGFKDIHTEYGKIYYNGMVIDEEDYEDFAWDEYSAEAEDNDECPCQEYFEYNLKPEWFKKVLDKYCATLNL